MSDLPAADNDLLPPDAGGWIDPFAGQTGGLGAKLARGAVNALTDLVRVPGDVFTGKYPVSDLPMLGRQYAGELAAAGIGVPMPPGALGSIKGFHGTPHMFEPVEHNPFGEFRNEAIGSGEGAQAYGYGHYVAGTPAVAETYQKSLGGVATLDGRPISEFANHPEYGRIGNRVISALTDSGGDVDKALKFLKNKAAEWEENLDNPRASGYSLGNAEAHNLLQQWNESGRLGPGGGHLLEVHILPHEHELLDWDKPLADQPPGVRQVIDKLHEGDENLRIMNSGPGVTGENFYRNLGRNLMVDKYGYDPDAAVRGIPHDQLASQALHEAGIPGIRYLDAGSRRANPTDYIVGPFQNQHGIDFGNTSFGSRDAAHAYVRQSYRELGDKINPDFIDSLITTRDNPLTHNYVIFDPSNLRIIGRNGQRLDPVDHDPFSPETKP